MAKSTNLNFTQTLKLSAAVITPTETTTAQTVFTAGAEDAVVKAINVASTDTAARILSLFVNDGSSDILIGRVNIPANSGNNGTAATVDLLGGTLMPSLPYDSNGKRVLPLPAGYILKAGTTTTVTSAQSITVTAMAEDY
jgi:hypothetical protein